MAGISWVAFQNSNPLADNTPCQTFPYAGYLCRAWLPVADTCVGESGEFLLQIPWLPSENQRGIPVLNVGKNSVSG